MPGASSAAVLLYCVARPCTKLDYNLAQPCEGRTMSCITQAVCEPIVGRKNLVALSALLPSLCHMPIDGLQVIFACDCTVNLHNGCLSNAE
jgi:hypothetical protein